MSPSYRLSTLRLSAAGIVSLACLSAAGAESRKDWKLSLEGGSEYDSNLHRVEVVEGAITGIDSGTLIRSGARYQLAWRPKKRQQLTLDLRGATKLFTVPEGQSENLAIVYLDGRYQRYLGKTRALLGFRGNYYEAIDIRPFGEGTRPVVGRSFRTSEGEVSLTLPNEGEHRISLLAGMRDFVYKPDEDFNWQGEHLGLRYATMFWLGDPDKDEGAASIDLNASYRVSLRDYRGAAFRNACSEQEMAVPECFVPTGVRRSDLYHSVVVEGSYTGRHIFSLLYGAQVVDSNSYGQASIRQRVEAGMTTEVPGRIFATAKAVVRLNTFIDPLLLARDVQSQTFVSIEDENRNSLSLHLARDFGKDWGVEGRYAFYSNEFATEELRFRRQTAYLGVLYRFGNESEEH
jgi:hypothetical protein